MAKILPMSLRARAELELRRRPKYSSWHLKVWGAAIDIFYNGAKTSLYAPGIENVFLSHLEGRRPVWFQHKLPMILTYVCETWREKGLPADRLKNEQHFSEAIQAVNCHLTTQDWSEHERIWTREVQAYEDKIYRRSQ